MGADSTLGSHCTVKRREAIRGISQGESREDSAGYDAVRHDVPAANRDGLSLKIHETIVRANDSLGAPEPQTTRLLRTRIVPFQHPADGLQPKCLMRTREIWAVATRHTVEDAVSRMR